MLRKFDTRKKLLERFVRYVKIDTTSDPDSTTSPSSKNQFDLANLLVKELQGLGLSSAKADEFCQVTATLPSNLDSKIMAKVPKIGFLAHLDTSHDSPGKDVKPQVIENYRGGDISLLKGAVIRASECPSLGKCIGHTLITTDGSTLLGADDKAGIAAIMTALEYFLANPDIKHGELKIAFTPDEEVGHGVANFNIKEFGADFAYTVDSGMSINKETFSADAALISITGRNIHPGKAKDIMVNSIKVVGEILARLPLHMCPERTTDYEPFIHPTDLTASVSEAKLRLILRDFNTQGLTQQKLILETIISEVNKLFPEAKISLDITPTYRNMREKLEENPKVLELLSAAVKKSALEMEYTPIRGGTDGSGLTEMGLPTPNLFYGGDNMHAVTEWLSINILEKAVETIVNIAELAVVI